MACCCFLFPAYSAKYAEKRLTATKKIRYDLLGNEERNEDMWFIFSLLTALAWGGSDLFSKMGTDPKDKESHWRMVVMVGLVMGVHAIGFLLFTGMEYNPINLIKYLPVSLLYIVSMIFGYVGLRYIELSVSSPICNSSGAVTAVLCFLFLGQEMSCLQLGAVVLICGGILGLSFLEKRNSDLQLAASGQQVDRKYRASWLAILLPILYCIIDGLGTFADALVLDGTGLLTEEEANISYELTFLICGIIALLYITLVKKKKFNFWSERIKGVGAICETVGQFFYVYAIADNAIVAAPMIASYSIFSVLLSRIFLKEKLTKWQYAVVAVVMLGIAVLGLAEEL